MFLLLLGRWSWSVLQHNNETKVLMRGEGSRGTDNNFTKYIDHGIAWYSLKVVRVKCNNGIKNGFLKSIKKIYQELCFILIFLLYYIDLDNTRVLQYMADPTMVRSSHWELSTFDLIIFISFCLVPRCPGFRPHHLRSGWSLLPLTAKTSCGRLCP